MKWLRYLLYLVVLLVLIGVFLPSKTGLERSINIDAEPQKVYAYLVDLHNFNDWSPWHRLDPNAVYDYSGPESGVGAIMQWVSNHKNVGSGTQKIVDTLPGRRIDIMLDFGAMGIANSSYFIDSALIEPGRDGATVTWTFEQYHGWNLLDRYTGFFALEHFLGPAYEEGLANLKTVLETEEQKPMIKPIEITTEEIRYQVGDETFSGYLAYPVDAEPGPGILVVHEWWGLNDYARSRVEMLAREGYSAFAADMYGSGKVTDHPDQAGKFMQAVTEQAGAAKARFSAALKLLQNRPSVQPDQLAAIGYCFGGAVVLNMARAGLPLKGVASFHGVLATPTPAQPGQVQAKVQVYHGNDDPLVPPEQVQAFKDEMEAAGVDYEFIGYDGVAHSFTNPAADGVAEKYGMPVGYDPAADADSWKGMLKFFEELFAE